MSDSYIHVDDTHRNFSGILESDTDSQASDQVFRGNTRKTGASSASSNRSDGRSADSDADDENASAEAETEIQTGGSSVSILADAER